MKNSKDFLENNKTAQHFNERLSVFMGEYKRYKERNKNKSLKILDVGCGVHCELAQYLHEGDEYFGVDFYKESEIKGKFVKYFSGDLNEQKLENLVSVNTFDVIFCGEVIEHLFSPDALMREMYKLLNKDGILILSTPNLAYWLNRVLLVFGISPFYLENSSEIKLGRKFSFLGQGNKTEGHIRLFTYGALREFVQKENFTIVKIVPVIWKNFIIDRFICKVSRSLAPNNVFVLKKKM